ncbi:MAG: hypothetical protein IT369_06405, partial [Candidatus Latescibacteria bacterium]|nr:hypothetical protein [Candidatus Latescibacterota bacterium]
AEVRIFDVEGRLQQFLVEDEADGGVVWDGRGVDGQLLPSGVYLFRVSLGTEVRLGKLALVRD